MDRFVLHYNQLLTNKMQWMAQKLRYYNDPVSIINWASAMASLKHLLLCQPENASVPPKLNLAQPLPTLTLSAANYISWTSQATNPTSCCRPGFLRTEANFKAINIDSNAAKTTIANPFSTKTFTAPAKPYRSSNFMKATTEPPSISRNVTLLSSENKPKCAASNFAKETERLEFFDRNKVKPKSQPIIDKAEPSQNLRQKGNPHALPTDKEFQVEWALLESDAAKANMEWTEYLTANRSKYPRMTKYLWCLPHDYIF